MSVRPPVLAFSQGDPAGIGPELLLRILEEPGSGRRWHPLLIAERAALEALRPCLPSAPWERLRYLQAAPSRESFGKGEVLVLDPVAQPREVRPGQPSPEDARGALRALDTGIRLARGSRVDALITAPVNKVQIATHLDPGFLGHTGYLAAACGLERYGRDYLMAFLTPSLRVALLSTHLPLKKALAAVTRDSVLDALRCLGRHVRGRIAVAGLNPHAGEGGLMGSEELEHLEPAIAEARRQGIDAHGPESPDTLFHRASRGEFDWVLALYHDQGLIAVKTAAFGEATNWTLGLPFLRTSVDHGTAYDIAGRGRADPSSLRSVLGTTLRLLAQRRD